MLKQKILIAEDHALFRAGLRALLLAAPELEVIGEARDGKEALDQARQLGPDLVLMDLTMPNLNGTEAIRAIKRHNPAIKFIALTIHKTEEYIHAALRAGASGYVLKDDTHEDLLAAIARVQEGKIYLSPGICDKVLYGYLAPASSNDGISWTQLTERQRQIIKLIAEGNKNREIAEFLSLSVKTVEKHRSNIMAKLNLHSVCELTRYAIMNALVSL
jgi:two-component system response regulator NreC